MLWLRRLSRLRSLRPVGTRRAATGTATASGQPWLLEERWWSSIFSRVEDMERRQTNVGHFLLTKKEFVLLRGR